MSHGTRNTDRTIAVEGLARVEGEGSLRAVVRDGVVEEVELEIFEPPRFFEALLRGRDYLEPPDITARVCGICPVAYQMSSCAAIEDACGVTVTSEIAALRHLLYCGEWIQSHALHVYLLHAPDFLGCEDAVELAERDRPAVERGLALKRIGNLIMETVGGRAVHPVNVRVGGFYRAPSREQIAALAGPVRVARDLALATVEWVAGFDFPDVEGEYLFVALHDPVRYAIDSGRVRSSAGVDTDAAGFRAAIVEEQVARTTALQSRLFGRDAYLTGPLARYALNRDQLGPLASGAAHAAGLGDVCHNPFRSIVVRSVELVEACDQALGVIEMYEPPSPASVDVPPRAGTGTGATEAPRGVLLHSYEIGVDGLITSAQIVPPTSQNQLSIEADLRRVVQSGLDLPDDELARRCEQAVRNHDPCISCAAHFLDVEVVRA
ncbi:MAG TPA: Ni/Fe hydrogenase subunit alpha [Acidimicrobiales bacterium]|nr:Ni/Fe hydrogenase subunit alpha [Acidimicrobiales bacterium]